MLLTKLTGRAFLIVSLLAFAGCKDDPPKPPGSGSTGGRGGSGGSAGGTGGRGGSGGSTAGSGGAGGSSAGSGGSGTADAATDGGAAVQLKMTWWGSPDRAMRTQQVIAMFEAKNPGIKIATEFWQPTQDGGPGVAYWPTLLKYQADKTLPDIMQHDYAYIEEWTKRGDLRVLDDLVADKTLNLDDVPAKLVDGGKVGGKLMGVSLGLNTQVIAIDTELFAKNNIALPTDEWTWEDFERIVTEIKTKTGGFGAGGGLHNYTPGWKAVFLSNKQWVFAADGKSLGYMDDKPWVDHFNMLLRLQDKGAIPQLYQEPKGTNINGDLIVTKQSGLTWLFSNQLVALWNAANTANGGVERQFKLYPVPRIKGATTISPVYLKPSQYFSVTATSKYPKESAKFIDFFTNDVEANKILAGERGVPINTKVLTALKPTLSKAAAESFALIERAGVYAQPTPPNDPPGWTTILTQILEPRTIPGIMYKTWTAAEGCERFRREANAVLGGGMVPDGGGPDLGNIPEASVPDAPPPPPDGGVPDVAVDAPVPTMSFFVTSTGSATLGGNLGGLPGADAKCESLAAAVGAGGKGWKAFLSTNASGGTAAVNAKDRIGAGPWRNQKLQMVAANLTALLAGPAVALIMDEKGAAVPMDWHEVLTGSQADGTAYAGRTCTNWTSNAATDLAQVGISTDADRTQWISSHMSNCSQAGLEANGSQGRLYCFATAP